MHHDADRHQSLQFGARQERGELHAADADRFFAAERVGLSGPARGSLRKPAIQLARDARTLPPARGSARGARCRVRRHRCGDGAQHPRGLRGAFRSADGRSGVERAQHPPRPRHDRLHAASRRGQGADHRYRIFASHRAGSGAARATAHRDRHRRCGGTGRRPARRDGLRSLSRDRRPGIPGADTQR